MPGTIVRKLRARASGMSDPAHTTPSHPAFAAICMRGSSASTFVSLVSTVTASAIGCACPASRAPYRVLDELVDWCARHNVGRVSDLIGAMQE